MSFEQYQFQRYYLPGSLFLIYFTLLLMPFVDWSVLRNFVGGNFLPLVTLVTAGFVASPALGYLLYCLYDPRPYNKRFTDWRQRHSLRLLLEWGSDYQPRIDDDTLCVIRNTPPLRLKKELEKTVCLERLRPSLKSAIDSLIHSTVSKQRFQISSKAADNLRGYWGHFATRFVGGLIVPAVASFLFFIFFLVVVMVIPGRIGPKEGGLFLAFGSVPSTSWLWFFLQFTVMWFVSLWIFAAREYPRSEAFELEYDMISSMIVNQDVAASDPKRWNKLVEHIPLRKNLNKRIREARIAYKMCSDIRKTRQNRKGINTWINEAHSESGLTVADLRVLFEEITKRIGRAASRHVHNRTTEYENWFRSQEKRRGQQGRRQN